MKTLTYIKSDLYRYYGEVSLSIGIKAYFVNRSFKYSFWLRCSKSDIVFLSLFAKVMHRILSTRYSIQIPTETEIGYGLYIGHGTSLIISPFTKIGNNVNFSQFTSVGTVQGTGADIGDNVYVGPNVSIVEDVKIGSGAIIGASTVVINDVPENSVSVGNPNRVVKIHIINEINKNLYKVD
ncbi:serine O-acetyltransferase [Aeromonas veronii]|uniref:serine O-acetyltransferase n=1 Tax=Aeromonas veronii TaxID=654 RepID=UPI003D1D34F8